MKKSIPIVSLLLLLSIFLDSCEYLQLNKATKEEYIRDYNTFIKDLEKAYPYLDKEAWAKKDREMLKYSQEMYNAFGPELSFREKLELGKYPILYYLMKYKGLVENEINTEYKGDIKMLKRNLSEIMDTTEGILSDYDRSLKEMLREFESRGTQETPE